METNLNQPAARALLEIRNLCYEKREVFCQDLLGKALKQLRGDAGISLRDMARRLDVSTTFLMHVEQGTRRLDLGRQIKYIESVQEGNM